MRLGEWLSRALSGEQLYSEPSNVSYREGTPRTVRWEQIPSRQGTPISRLHLEQGTNRCALDFVGYVQAATSQQGETVAAVGSLKTWTSAKKSGLHIWWGDRYQFTGEWVSGTYLFAS